MSLFKRLAEFLPVFFGITLLTFSLLYFSPGDPIGIRLSAGGVTADPATIAAMREEMGLNDTFIVQYSRWLTSLLQGDMGKSYITDRSVADLCIKALPYTLKMAGLAMALTLAISVPLGILLAARRDSLIDYSVRLLSFVGNAVPSFIIALCLMYVFSYRLDLIPVLAMDKPIGMILPTATLALLLCSRFVNQVRTATLEELGKEYVIGLRSRGITERTILFRSVLKNIMVVVVTLTALSIGSLLGGTVIVETIFNWPGLGNLMMTAIEQRDYPIVQAIAVWMAMIFFAVNLLADLSYRRFNPKIRAGRG